MRKNTTIHKLVRMGMDNIMHHLVLQRGVNASLRVKRCVPTREMRQFLKLLTILPGSTGLGPSTGINQFGIFLLNGAVGRVKDNIITEGACGTLSPTECFNLRSEGVVLRLVGDGTVVDHNVINHAQSGIFLNAVNRARITNNLIGNIDALDGIDMQGTSNSLVDGNIIFHLTPLENLSEGVFETSGPGSAGGIECNNEISNNTVNDTYCGVAFVPTSHVENGKYFNVLYPELLSNGQPGPPPTEP